ncbi:MAG: hypothetical protein Q7K42_02940, partial [Candidatus Diapherotrites archaeon]|nr:hypothetical protein [Candidatus Diapherotrites archaeon]
GGFFKNQAFIWEDFSFDSFWEAKISVFKKQKSGLYKLFQESVLERGYELKTLKRLFIKAGFKKVQFINKDTLKSANKNSLELYGIARK